MPFIADVVKVACNTGAGTQDITGRLGGLTPKAAIFIRSKAATEDSATDEASITVGFVTASNQVTGSAVDEDNQDPADRYTQYTTTTYATYLLTADGALDGYATFTTFIANGVRINWGVAPGTAHLMTVVLLAGTGFNVAAGITTLSTEDTEVNVTSPGFEPNVALAFCTHVTSTPGAHYNISWGATTNDGVTITQKGMGLRWTDAASSTSENHGQMLSNRVGASVDNTGIIYSVEIANFDSQGFSLYARDGDGTGHRVLWLAIEFTDATRFWLNTKATPTSTGVETISDPGFQGGLILLGISNMLAVDTNYASDSRAGVIGIGAISQQEQGVIMNTSEQKLLPSNTKSFSNNVAFDLNHHDGTARCEADFVNMHSNGWRWNWTDVDTSGRYYWALAIEGAQTYFLPL